MLDREFHLRDDFPPASYDEWRALAEADLAGASFEQKLITHTYEGIDLQPVYTCRDHLGDGDSEGFPGLPPFVRGSEPLGPVGAGWDLCQEHAHPDLSATNDAILEDLHGGVTSLLLRLDVAARHGLDPDDANAAELSGRDGLMAYHTDDLDAALAGVHLNMVGVTLDAGAAAAGTLGGVARKTREGMLVCEAAGFQVILIETVGVGQSETIVSEMTDCFLALMMPGAGDELQGIKRGLLELVDVIAVNKADGQMRPAVELAAQQYRAALQLLGGRRSAPAVFTCSAMQKEGIDRVWEAIEGHCARMTATGELPEKRRRQNLRWLWALVDDQVRQAIHAHPAVRKIQTDLEREVLAGSFPAAAAARRILAAFRQPHDGPN